MKKFHIIDTGVADYEKSSQKIIESLKKQTDLNTIKEDTLLVDDLQTAQKVKKSYKDLFGKVASVGQSYFSDNDFGTILRNLYCEESFLLDKESIKNIEVYFKERKDSKKKEEKSKRYSTPYAATCRLLMALFPDKFCPIPTPNKVDYLMRKLIEDGFINKENIKEVKKNIKEENWLIKWCVYNNILFQIFTKDNQNSNNPGTASSNSPITPWKALVQYGQEKKREEIKNLLVENHNIILTGAPGTGKTYMAKQIAVEMTKNAISGLSGNVEEDFEKLKNNGNVGFVQFHPSYDYTDFVEGLRPNDNANGFERRNGIFKKFCDKAAKAEKEDNNKIEKNELTKEEKSKFVFVIDEINRGEISKIFGELFFSIDPGYRGEKGKVDTQYQNLILPKIKDNNKEIDNPDPFKDGFYVPENVYIIGTMNDIDRSVESMDFAFRRRFAFYEITAEDSKSMLWDGDNYQVLEDVMDRINKELIKPQYGLSEAYQIGASYFNKKKKPVNNNDYDYKTELKDLWEYHIKGLVFEYLRGKPNVNDLLKQLEKAYFGKSLEDLVALDDGTQG